jgi:hypothetical protein
MIQLETVIAAFIAWRKRLAMARTVGCESENEMIQEIIDHRLTYAKLLGSKKDIQTIVENLNVEISNNSSNPPEIGKHNWLSTLSHGQILANDYARPVVFLSLVGSCTCLPLRIGLKNGYGPLYLLRVRNNQWVLVDVEANDEVMPIPPPILAPKVTSKAAKGWLTRIKKGQTLYKKGLEGNKI